MAGPREGAGPGQAAREQARLGVRGWVRGAGARTAAGARKATPYGILAFLTASALAPVAAPSLGGGPEFTAALNQLGGMGGNYLAEVMTQTAERMRQQGGEGPAGAITEQEWRDALAEALTPRLEATDEAAAELRGEVGRILQAVDAVAVALGDAAQSSDEVREWLAGAVRELASDVRELHWMQGSLSSALAGIQLELAEQSTRQRQQIDLTRRSLVTVTAMRAELLDSLSAAVRSAAVRPDRAEQAGRSTRSGGGGGGGGTGGAGEAGRGGDGGEAGGGGDGGEAGGGVADEEGLAEPSDPAVDDCPYPGLVSFQVEDSQWFVGREALVAEMLGRLAEQRHGTGPLVVVGVSGVGKSSVLQAGLLPAIDRGELAARGSSSWPWMLLTPGAKPLTELAGRIAAMAGVSALTTLAEIRQQPERFGALAALAARAGAPPPTGSGTESPRLVIVVDQFEEIFAAGVDEAERAAFVTALTSAAPALVVLAVRADFYPQCIRLAPLAPQLSGQQLVVGPLRVDDLRRAVLQPAARAGLRLEPGLTDLLLADLGVHPDDGYEPGSLPLLAFALRATWQRRAGDTLTIAGYRATGGIADAVAETAEGIYQALDDESRQALRSTLLRTVTINPADERVVRHPADLRDVDPAVLSRLVQARLVTVDERSVQLSHEALLHAWPRLNQWVAEGRQGLRLHQQLAQATRDWTESGEDESLLYRGARLAAAREWASGRGDLGSDEERFLLAGITLAQHELRTEQRRTRRLRQLVAVLVLLLLTAVTGATGAFLASRSEREQAAQALSRQYAAESAVVEDANLRRSMELAVLAWQASPTTEAHGALLSAQMRQHAGRLDDPGGTSSVAVSPDGRRIATGARTGEVRLWDATTHRQLHVLRAHGEFVSDLAFSPDGRYLASAAIERGLRIWDASTGRLLRTLPAGFASFAWRGDGRVLASLSIPDEGTSVVQWNPADGRELDSFVIGGTPAPSMSFSPDGRRIAIGRGDGGAGLWRMRDGRKLATLPRADGIRPGPGVVAFAPDGLLATSSSLDGQVHFWDGETGRSRGATTPASGRILTSSLAFTPDSRLLIVAGTRSTAQVWSRPEGDWAGSVFTGDGGGALHDIAFSADGRLLAGGYLERQTALWRRGTSWFTGDQTEAMIEVAFHPNGREVAVGGGDGLTEVWTPASGSSTSPVRQGAAVGGVAFAPDGTLATAADDGTIHVVRPDGRRLGVLEQEGIEFADVTFSPDGALLAATSSTPTIPQEGDDTATRYRMWVWDVPTLDHRMDVNLGTLTPFALDFTPDGEWLVLTGTEEAAGPERGAVRLWSRQSLRDQVLLTDREFSLASGDLRDAEILPDSRRLAVGGPDRTIQLWDLASGRQVDSFGTLPDVVRAIAVSPDGRRLATGVAGDGVIRLWDIPGRRLVAALRGHDDDVNGLAFSPDSQTLASVSSDGSAGLWNLRPEVAVQRICQSVSGPLLRGDWTELGVQDLESAPCTGT